MSKFGMTREQIFSAVERLQRMGVKRFGLHAFLASNTIENDYYPANARVLFQLAKDVHEALGADFFMINLSGGVGIPYRPEEPMPDIAQHRRGASARPSMRSWFPQGSATSASPRSWAAT